jgi:Flp pilus assembly protein TadB
MASQSTLPPRRSSRIQQQLENQEQRQIERISQEREEEESQAQQQQQQNASGHLSAAVRNTVRHYLPITCIFLVKFTRSCFHIMSTLCVH